jgi:hypothetical protein
MLPGKLKGVDIILPKGLTFMFPDSGSSTDVITPKDFSVCVSSEVSTILKTPEESR